MLIGFSVNVIMVVTISDFHNTIIVVRARKIKTNKNKLSVKLFF